jgi:aspartate kinase
MMSEAQAMPEMQSAEEFFRLHVGAACSTEPSAPGSRGPDAAPASVIDRDQTGAASSAPETLPGRRTEDLVVCKFGGSSVGDLERLRGVARRLVALQKEGRKVVAVLSAMGDSTDHLVDLAHRICDGPPAREFDALLSLGESMSCALAAMMVQTLGARAVSLTASQAGIFTDDTHGCAQLDEIRPQRILDAVADGCIVLVAGFQGISAKGDVTTLGRGGSDASAVALAAALGVSRCEIFTDVTGVFTADPGVVSDARQLPALSHEEMLLLAAAGAAVMQPRAVELAMTNDVDIHVSSTFAGGSGTWIRKESQMLEHTRLAGVAHRNHERLYTLRHVSPRAVAAALALRGATVGTLVRCGDEVRFTVPGADETDIAAALRTIGADLAVDENLGAVSVVGVGVGSRPEIAARALAVLEGLGIEPQLVTNAHGTLCFHVSSMAVNVAARALHDALVLQRDDARHTDRRRHSRRKARSGVRGALAASGDAATRIGPIGTDWPPSFGAASGIS